MMPHFFFESNRFESESRIGGFLEVLHCEHHEFVVVDLGLVGDAVLLFLGGSSRLDQLFGTQKVGMEKVAPVIPKWKENVSFKPWVCTFFVKFCVK